MKLYHYICITYVNLDIASAESLRARLARNGFLCQMTDEFVPMTQRVQIVKGADMLIAVTSSAAALGTSVASDLRQAKGQGKDVLIVSLESAELDARFSAVSDTGIEAIPYPVGEFPDHRSVSLFVHRAFIRRICKHYACFEPGQCEDSEEGRVICDAVLAHTGDGQSRYRLGLAYINGTVVPAMEDEAAKWIDLAAEQGVPDALIHMGQLRLDGRGTERDNYEAYRLFHAAATEGDPRGAYYMGICCLNGFGIMKDSEMAARYFDDSAKGGYAPAAYQLALLYRDGNGVDRSFVLAVRCLWQAASPSGDNPAPGRHGYRKNLRYKCVSIRHMRQNKIGKLLFGAEYTSRALSPERTMLLKGCFSRSKYKPAIMVECLRTVNVSDAIDPARINRGKGYSETIWDSSMAAYELGRMLESGSVTDGILPDARAAIYWYREAIKRNHSDAYVCMAACYKRGFGVLRDAATACGLYEKAAKVGNESAQYNLGVCYERGDGVERNLTEAVRWYEPSAYAGYAPAQNNLGGCYENALGVEQNLLLAVDWYSRAASQGQPDATCRLGLCYEMGRGVVRDEERAVTLYREAARTRHPFAEYRLGVCYDRGIGLHQHFAHAAEFYEKAAEGGLPQAQYALALCSRSGRGILRDEGRSFELFCRAAEGGSLQAAYETGCAYLEGRTAVSNPERAVAYLNRAVRMYEVMHTDASVFREDCLPPAEAMTITEAASEALYTLAYCKLYGIGSQNAGLTDSQRAQEAYALCKRAAELGSSRAMAMLGDFAHFGIMGESNIEEARLHYENAMAAGNDYAMYRLGLYAFQKARAISDEKVRREEYCSAWNNFSAAAGKGNADALIYLSSLAMMGEGTSKNPYRAVSLLERAADSGSSPVALLLLGDSYLYGNGVKANEQTAIELYSRAASTKSRIPWTDKYALRDAANEILKYDTKARAEALYRLGVFYAVRENDVVEEDTAGLKGKLKRAKKRMAQAGDAEEKRSLKYLGAAILGGHKMGLEDMARMLAYGVQTPTYYKSLGLAPVENAPVLRPTVVYNGDYTPSFLRGEVTEMMRANALNHLGDRYFYGKQVEKDPSVAVKFYRMAADMGQVWAQYSLGWCLLNACGTEKNPREAVGYFARSAKSHAESAFCLARCYEEGLGVGDPDPREALKFYRRAAKLGSKAAPAKIKAMEKRLRELAADAVAAD